MGIKEGYFFLQVDVAMAVNGITPDAVSAVEQNTLIRSTVKVHFFSLKR